MTKKQKENLAMKEWAEANSNYIEDQYVIYFNDQKYAKKWEYPGNMLIDSNKPSVSFGLLLSYSSKNICDNSGNILYVSQNICESN